jgi:TRAP-type transport system periplasmic protein
MLQRKSLIAAALVATALIAPATQARELVYGAWVSPKHPVIAQSLPILFKGVEKETNGAIKWKMIAGGQLVNGRGTLTGVRDGLIDAGFGIPAYTPNNIPAINLVYSTLIFGENVVAASGASTEAILLNCPQCISELKKSKAVFLGGYSVTPFKLICRSRISSLADIKGKKVRGAGGGVYLLRDAGAVPVAMSPAQATTALQRGALDCVHGAPSWLKSYGYQDVAKFILDYPLGMYGPVLSMLINRKSWDKLTVNQKKIHLKYAPKVIAHSTITSYLLRDEAILKNAQKIGVTLVPGNKNELDALVALRVKNQRQQNIENALKFGVKNPEAISDAYAKALAKWVRLSKEIGRDVGKFEAALKREIFDKVDINKL